MSTQNNQLVVPQADSAILVDGLNSLQQSLLNAADDNIRNALGEAVGHYSAVQMRSMVMTEALRLTSGMDLTTILTRGQLILQIEHEGLVGVHPNGYANLTALAAENGVSVGEFSDIRALVETIFPYIQNVLGWSLLEIWERVGKSNFREMVPALRSLITGAPADHATVRGAVEAMLNTAAISVAEEGNIPTTEVPEATARRRAVENLLNDGMVLPTRQLRRRVRPSRVPSIQMATLQTADAQWYAVLRLNSQEQRELVNRVLSDHTDNMVLDGRGDQASQFRNIFPRLFGDEE